tara:strand:+ start:280 stop:735 length:456 start_codon:yes stop_codon:yes gene_type:complete
VIRDATAADLPALMALERAAFAADAQTARSMRWLVDRANSRFRVIEAPGGVGALSGYCVLLFRRGSRVARLYSIAVDSAARGQGIGARLVADALASATKRGDTVMRAEARMSNRSSRGLFAAAGFVETERLVDYYPGPEDGIRLKKQLERD